MRLVANHPVVERVKGRESLFGCSVEAEGVTVFDVAWVSLRLKDVEASKWLAAIVIRAIESKGYVAPNGHGNERDRFDGWEGNLDDDCRARINGLDAHVEHLSGPRRGGIWFCAVSEIFSSNEVLGLEVRSGNAARWLCEIIANAA